MRKTICAIFTVSELKGGVDMKLSVEQIPREGEEEVIVRCYDTQEKWVEAICAVTAGEVSVSASSMLFRCGKSMILNADKIQYVRPSVSGRFEATLTNHEKVIISRQYVGELKRLLGV